MYGTSMSTYSFCWPCKHMRIMNHASESLLLCPDGILQVIRGGHGGAHTKGTLSEPSKDPTSDAGPTCCMQEHNRWALLRLVAYEYCPINAI